MRFHWRQLTLALAVSVGLLAGTLQSRQSVEPAGGRVPRTYIAYFYLGDRTVTPLGGYLIPVVFPLPEEALGTEPLRLAFQALCDEPPPFLTSALKHGCKVRSAQSDGRGTLVVDFEADVFQRAGTTGDTMVVEQLAMTAAQFHSQRVRVTYRRAVPTDLGSHGIGNNFPITGRSQVFLVTPPVLRGQRPETESLGPDSAAVRNATRALARPLLGVINRRLSELGRTQYLVKKVEYIVPSGDGTLWVKVPGFPGFYRLWWTGKEWQVDRM